MKKRIAFVISQMVVGGTEKSLIELLERLDYSKYDVTLWVYHSGGDFISKVPARVSIRCCNTTDQPSSDILFQQFVHLKLKEVARGVFYRLLARSSGNWMTNAYYSAQALPLLDQEPYDCIVAYQGIDVITLAVALKRLRGAKRVMWIHGNDSFPPERRAFYAKICRQFDHVFLVSEATREEFGEKYNKYGLSPQSESVFYNILSRGEIVSRAEELLEENLRSTALVTVGRLSREKGQNMIPKTARVLLDEGYDFYWYLVGDGQLRETVEAEIQKCDVSDRVILLGTKMNPYPYIKNCDLYVQTSFSEGWCLTVQEARILRKPIVTTPLPVMHEQIISGENGLIAEDVTPEALAESIKLLLDHPELREKFVEQLSREVCDNSGELQKLYDFIES